MFLLRQIPGIYFTSKLLFLLMNFFIKQFQITKCNGALVYSLYSPDKRISDPDRFPSNLSTVPLSFILCVSSVGNKTQL